MINQLRQETLISVQRVTRQPSALILFQPFR